MTRQSPLPAPEERQCIHCPRRVLFYADAPDTELCAPCMAMKMRTALSMRETLLNMRECGQLPEEVSREEQS